VIKFDDEDYMTAEEAADALGVKVQTLYVYVSRGLISSYREGIRRRRLYKASDVARLARLAPARPRPRPPLAEDWIPLT
jgi:excisionase family DNA binding protein